MRVQTNIAGIDANLLFILLLSVVLISVNWSVTYSKFTKHVSGCVLLIP